VLAAESPAPPETDRQLTDCFELMRTLVQCRQEPIREELGKIRKLSMLHLDVLFLIYQFAKTCPGHVLEIGAFLGGGTMAAALGVRDSDQQKMLIAIEPGGSLKHPQLPSRDIYRDLQRNLRKHGFADVVTLINGRSFEPATVAALHEAIGSEEIGLLIVDADGQVKRDIGCYENKLADRCAVLIDDYLGPAAKAATTRKDVDELVAAGRLEPLGFYGWGTWVGRWHRRSTIAA
jgi:predicted O-methyltransferase YrrM